MIPLELDLLDLHFHLMMLTFPAVLGREGLLEPLGVSTCPS